MYPSNRFRVLSLSRARKITQMSAFLATCGTIIVLLGGIWDSASHELKIPETFWTVQHATIYSGASLIACSAIAAMLVLNHCEDKFMKKGIIMILLGAMLQVIGGYADYNFHEIYGIDGLVTPSHLTVETGLLLSAIGGFITLSKSRNHILLKISSISIMAILLSAAWIGLGVTQLSPNDRTDGIDSSVSHTGLWHSLPHTSSSLSLSGMPQ
ncbi:MAG: hypothetical protein WBE60_09095, partial [Nitrosotalea sp.]